MRKNYIDNLRWLCVLFLFPYHTFMVFNNFGESFYVKGVGLQSVSMIMRAVYPWLMPLLFLIAGVSSAYALEKRTPKEYLRERVFKLLIPFLFGLLLLVPIQTYFAELFHNNYIGSYFEQYVLFFSKPTDLSGYKGGFTPAHLWFILYLFIISVVSLPLMSAYRKSTRKLQIQKLSLPLLILFFVLPVFSQAILDIGGKSIGEYLTYFLFGYFVISNDSIQEKLSKRSLPLFCVAFPCMLVFTFLGRTIEEYNSIIFELFFSLYAWTATLAIIGLGKRCFNFSNRATDYLSKSSFSIYVLHQQWIVVTAYIALMCTRNIALQMVFIALASVVLTFLNHEIFKRISVTRFMFGIRN